MVARCLLGLAAALLTAAVDAPQRAPDPRPTPRIALGEAQIDDALEIAGDSVAGEQVDTRMVVGVTIDGRGPFRFVVDSGADRSVVGERLARDLALPPGAPVVLHDMAGASRRATARIARLGLGGSVVENVAAPTLPEAYLGAHGLIGIDALRGQRLRLDFEANSITVEDARRPVRAEADEIVVTARRRGGQLILTQARAGGIGLRAVIDTGSQLTIGNLAMRDALFRRRRLPPVEATAALVSVTGQAMSVPLSIVPEMRIGSIVMRNVLVGFADLPPFALFGLHDAPAMLLGTDLMANFRRVSLDSGAKRVRFQLRRCTPARASGWRSMRPDDPSSPACPPAG